MMERLSSAIRNLPVTSNLMKMTKKREKMKTIFSALCILAFGAVDAQVAIGAGAVPTNNYVSIEFGTAAPAEPKGILLPRVDSEAAVSSSVVGTFIFDVATQKIKLGTTSTPSTASTPGTTHSAWFDYSSFATTPATQFGNPAGYTDATDATVIVGANSTTANGILILETPNADTAPKAMVLPRVNAYTDIVNPSAGMIVYVKTNKRFAVYNGSQWSFWEPAN